MNNQHVLEQAMIVEALLDQNGVDVEDMDVNTMAESISLHINPNDVDADPKDPDSPIDPSKVGGGTTKNGS